MCVYWDKKVWRGNWGRLWLGRNLSMTLANMLAQMTSHYFVICAQHWLDSKRQGRTFLARFLRLIKVLRPNADQWLHWSGMEKYSRHIFYIFLWVDMFSWLIVTALHEQRFRVYQAGSSGPYPLLLLLHGGGHSALTWSVFTVSYKSLH